MEQKDVTIFLNTHKIILYRKLMGLRQAELAKIAGVRTETYTNMEYGRTRLKTDQKQRVLDYFNEWRNKQIEELSNHINYLKQI